MTKDNRFGQGNDLEIRLREACDGHPHAKIPWPHRLIHEAADEILRLRKDGERFRFLQNLPVVEAQAFFWNYGSRTERAKAIDKAMHALIDRIEEKK